MQAASENSTLLKVEDLTISYLLGKNARNALDGVSFEIPASGYTLGIVGESGSGKTTLGMSLLNMVTSPGKILGGKIHFQGKDVLAMKPRQLKNYRGLEVSMVYQSAQNSLNPVKSALDHVKEVILQHTPMSKAEVTEKATRLLGEVGISSDRIRGYPHEFSGGMRQRVVIAMALSLSPKLLIADEPTSALDVVVQRQILALISKEVSEKGLSLLFITHEIALTSGFVDNICVMYAGEIVEIGATDNVLFAPLHPYSEALIGSLLSLETRKEILVQGATKTESGVELLPLMQPNVCRYSNRCKYVFDRCRRERPLLRQVEKGRWVACHKYS